MKRKMSITILWAALTVLAGENAYARIEYAFFPENMVTGLGSADGKIWIATYRGDLYCSEEATINWHLCHELPNPKISGAIWGSDLSFSGGGVRFHNGTLYHELKMNTDFSTKLWATKDNGKTWMLALDDFIERFQHKDGDLFFIKPSFIETTGIYKKKEYSEGPSTLLKGTEFINNVCSFKILGNKIFVGQLIHDKKKAALTLPVKDKSSSNLKPGCNIYSIDLSKENATPEFIQNINPGPPGTYGMMFTNDGLVVTTGHAPDQILTSLYKLDSQGKFAPPTPLRPKLITADPTFDANKWDLVFHSKGGTLWQHPQHGTLKCTTSSEECSYLPPISFEDGRSILTLSDSGYVYGQYGNSPVYRLEPGKNSWVKIIDYKKLRCILGPCIKD